MNKTSASYHSREIKSLFEQLNSSSKGLDAQEATRRLEEGGRNVLPTQPPPTSLEIFLHQFRSPLIYVLLAAAIISALLGDYTDSIFIGLVLLVNAVIGTIQEYGAEKSAKALRQMVASKCLVERNGKVREIEAESLVPGDIVLLESGQKVPADLRLLNTHNLEIDESLLTGESVSVQKDHEAVLSEDANLAERKNMAFKGSLVIKGRGRGLVVSTGLHTELGAIASSISHGTHAKPPLLIRMERFTKKIALFLLIIVSAIGVYLVLRGDSWHDVLVFSVAVAVSAIPEGLPVALTVALAIASRRMAKRNVIVRRLPAVEALGSCSFIATDKTGTLTVNQLTVKKLVLPEGKELEVSGSGLDPKGSVTGDGNVLMSLIRTGVLCNESQLSKTNGNWSGIGDAVDLAFMVLAHKAGITPEAVQKEHSLIDDVPFEPENQYAATLHGTGSKNIISVKGAFEKLLPMSGHMLTEEGVVAVDTDAITEQANRLAESGYRVLALAMKSGPDSPGSLQSKLQDLMFVGLVGMIDPLRPEAAEAIDKCHQAGIDVAMVTGDHPKTSLAIARELNLATRMDQVITGQELKAAKTVEEKMKLIQGTRVFARVEPQQKLEIVRYLLDQGSFVAVTGDGANDAPALKAANVGVAMGMRGTDIAKETSDLIITDDKFASIVAGVEEGRIAYSNVRKVIYLLISTGAAEILLFILSLLFNTPLPLTALQILWLNLVTNGIQDVGLAFEPGEGDELERKPRKPKEPVFDRLMLERIGLSALVMGGVSFFYFHQLLSSGIGEFEARNLTLLLMVLFQNIMVGNCRSETKSAFALNPLRNRVLLFGTIAAQLVHIAALHTPGLNDILSLEPVPFSEWVRLLLISLSVLVVIEIYKLAHRNLGDRKPA